MNKIISNVICAAVLGFWTWLGGTILYSALNGKEEEKPSAGEESSS